MVVYKLDPCINTVRTFGVKFYGILLFFVELRINGCWQQLYLYPLWACFVDSLKVYGTYSLGRTPVLNG